MGTRDNGAFVRDGLETGLRGDLDGFLAILDPAIEIHEPAYLPYGGVHRGHDGVAAMLRRAGRVVDFRTLEFVSTVADGDRVVMLMTVRLREGGGERRIIEHWALDGGLVREVRVFWDALP